MSSHVILFDVKLTDETIITFGDPICSTVILSFNKRVVYLFHLFHLISASFGIKYFISLDKFVNI